MDLYKKFTISTSLVKDITWTRVKESEETNSITSLQRRHNHLRTRMPHILPKLLLHKMFQRVRVPSHGNVIWNWYERTLLQ